MKHILSIGLLGASVGLAGCAAYKHDHEASGHDHGAMHEQHQNMMHKGEGMHHTEGMGDQGHHMNGHAHSMESLAGKPGTEANVDREIQVVADDNMRFSHPALEIKDGETIRFVITNQGQMPHEFSIGTKDEHMEHGQMMMANPNMHHGPGGNTVTVAPGQTETLIWAFENAWQIEVACNIPGHYQAGMHSPVRIEEP